VESVATPTVRTTVPRRTDPNYPSLSKLRFAKPELTSVAEQDDSFTLGSCADALIDAKSGGGKTVEGRAWTREVDNTRR
jgi:hypothetical protein